MGGLIDGRWCDEDTDFERGGFVRRPSVYGDDLSETDLAALGRDPERFLLIASASCPWSHRATILRSLKALSVPLHIAYGPRVEGYAVNGGKVWALPGAEREIRHLHQVYTAADPVYSGRATVPVLWDRRLGRIVSNESAKLLRAFDAVREADDRGFTLVPESLCEEIDDLNTTIQQGLSEAVYRAGLARAQAVYDLAVEQVFATLDLLERRLAKGRYLLGQVVTEADWRLFTTLVRFDAVYHGHFRCTRRRLVDYPALWAYARDLHSWRGIAETVDLAAIREGYYRNDGDHNPYGIVAVAPDAAWSAPHGRDTLGPATVGLRSGGFAKIRPDTLGLETS